MVPPSVQGQYKSLLAGLHQAARALGSPGGVRTSGAEPALNAGKLPGNARGERRLSPLGSHHFTSTTPGALSPPL